MACKIVRQHVKIVRNWLLVIKALLEYRQITLEFLNTVYEFAAQILYMADEAPYSHAAVMKYANSGRFGWLRALTEKAKCGSQELLPDFKSLALDVMVLLSVIRGNLQIIA